MKKLLVIVVLGLLLSGNVYAEDLKPGDTVKDPELIKELNELVKQKEKKTKEDHKNTFAKIYFDQYIKCTKRNFFSKNDIIYFGLPLKILKKELHGGWDVYKYDFTKWHIMKELNKKYYIFYKEPGIVGDLQLDVNSENFGKKSLFLYKIDRETGEMYELNTKTNSEKKVRNCEKISYSDLPMLETKAKF